MYLYVAIGNDYKESKHLYDKIKSEKESIKATAPSKRKKVTPIWLDFETNYQKDLEVNNKLSASITIYTVINFLI